MYVAWPCEQMKLIGINHQLRWDAERAQRLIHLFAANDRHIKIGLPSDEQRRCVDLVRVEKRI